MIEFLPEPRGQRRLWAARTGLAATLLVAAPASAERPATPLRAQAAAPEQRPPAAPAQKKDGATPRPAQQDPPAPRKGEAKRPPKGKLTGKPCSPKDREDI